MSKPTITVTLPDGTTETRQTSHDYTHVVAVRVSAEEVLKKLEGIREDLAKHERILASIPAGESKTVINSYIYSTDFCRRKIGECKLEIARCEARIDGYWTAYSWHGNGTLAERQLQKIASSGYHFESHRVIAL